MRADRRLFGTLSSIAGSKSWLHALAKRHDRSAAYSLTSGRT